jgi:hypothetical protein
MIKMPKKFFVIRNKDAADEFISALLSAGYSEVNNLEQADFLLFECEHGGALRDRIFNFVKTRPGFIYPHTPYSYWLWDGLYPPAPVACNFIVGDGARMGMKAYGYPYRVEVIGWTGCDIRSFVPTVGTKLLFAPHHLLNGWKYAQPEIEGVIRNAAQFILDNMASFESVDIRCSSKSLEHGLFPLIRKGAAFWNVDVYHTPNIRQDALKAIVKADIIISNGTFGYLSVASGKPTVMCGYRDMKVGGANGEAKHYDLYKDHLAFPLTIESMTIEEVLAVKTKRNEEVETWKELNIGRRFDAEKFVAVVKEFV